MQTVKKVIWEKQKKLFYFVLLGSNKAIKTTVTGTNFLISETTL